jgi:hypothetical protein
MAGRISQTSHVGRLHEFCTYYWFHFNDSSSILAYPLAFLIGMLGQFRFFQNTLFEIVPMLSELHG